MRRHSGYTIIELVTIIVILGILAVVALPRMNNNAYRSNEFRDRAVSALRYAQKTAVSHRRTVCVTFAANSVTLTMDTDIVPGCDQPVLLPGANANAAVSGDANTAFFNPLPTDFNFNANGTSTSAAARTQFFINVNNEPPLTITLERDTGYVD